MSWSLKNGYLASPDEQNIAYIFSSLSWYYFLEKHDELSELVVFAQKLRYFTDQNGPKRGQYENDFWVFCYNESYK